MAGEKVELSADATCAERYIWRGIPQNEEAVLQPSVSSALEAIKRGAQTGQIGDGKIFVLDLYECVRIRTAETGSAAVG